MSPTKLSNSYLSQIGILFNPNIWFRSLRGSTNYLLAMTSLFEILHQSGHLPYLFVSLSGKNFSHYLTSMYFQLPALFGVHASLVAITGTAFDRLLSVLIPT